MKWIGQHIYDLVARFRNDVYLEDLSTTTETNVLVVDSDGKVSKTTVITGDVTGVTAGDNITVTDPTGPVPTVALSTNVDVAGTLDVTGLGTFDASVTVAGKISLDDGGYSVFVGKGAGLNDDASANQNVGVGYRALYSNTTGYNNTANGVVALYNNTIGFSNTANGYAALSSNTTGSVNTANGYLALYYNTTGGGNTALGTSAGAFITDGINLNTVTSNSVFLGYNTKALASSQTNQIVIGYNAIGLGSNTAILGNSSITTTRLQGGIEINASDTTITRVSAGKIAVEGVNVVTTSSTDTLTNKTLTSPTLTTPALGTPDSGDLTNCTFPTLNQSTTGNADTATKIASITNSDIVQLTETQTLTFKTLYRPVIENYARFEGGTSGATLLKATAVAGSTTLTLPAATDTLVGRNTTDTLTNKTLTLPIIEGAGATFTGSTSGTTKLTATAVAGETVLTLPAAIDTLVGRNTIDTLTNKTLTSPTLTTPILGTPQSGDLTNCTFPTLNQSTTGNADTATKISSITNSDIVQLDATQTLTLKTLYRPTIQNYARFLGGTSGGTNVIATAVAGSTTLTLPAATDTLVGRATTDTLTNKTLTAPTITGAGAIAGVFTGNITGNVTGNADTVTTNANLTGPVTSTGNTTAIASGAITTDMQKHLQTFEFNGFISSAASTNYFIPTTIFENKGPFLHNVDAGASGTTALLPTALFRSGGKVMPYAGTCKLWKGWVGVSGLAAFKVSIFKYTPVPDDATPDSLVLVNEFSGTAAGNSNLIAIDLTTGFASLSAGDILITGISCASGAAVYFTSTLEVEWD
jgi:hypothetical protein